MIHLGLIGKKLGHSFSKAYFEAKFAAEKIAGTYSLYELAEISEFSNLLAQEKLRGLNVTIPYKEAIIPYLDDLSEAAKAVGAVNTIHFQDSGEKVGHNTDILGLDVSLQQILGKKPEKALILGTGGAAKAAAYVLAQREIPYVFLTRSSSDFTKSQLSYADFSLQEAKEYELIINCTPVGMYPDTAHSPLSPTLVASLSSKAILLDMIYNPAETLLMRYCKEKGLRAYNGLEMLHKQADAAWTIWTKKVPF